MLNVRLIVSLAGVLFFVAVPQSQARHNDWKDALKEQLESAYTLTKTGIDRLRITSPGIILVIRKDGISGDLSSDMTFLMNKVQEGRISQAGGFSAVMQDKKTSRVFKPGERVYVFDIKVKDDEVWLFTLSCDTFEVNVKGSTQQKRYKALLNFQFPKGFLATTEFAQVKEAIDSVLTIEQVGPKSIALGQTPEQVTATMGKPEKIINLGAKTVYVYKDLKVIFVDGRVADVQ
ncbi:MAG: hypothetical protein ACREEM_34750 [Blastocatellia bacterium]